MNVSIHFSTDEEKKLRKFLEEFKTFAMRGNVLDLAVGVIMGSAFTAIVTALVKNILMPVIGIVSGGIDVSKLSLVISGVPGMPKVTLEYGAFLQSVINFIIVAFCVFLIIKGITRFYPKKEKTEEEPEPDPTLAVLTEIRDMLKEQQTGDAD